ncbi:hypothetical protein PENTCL1PPCAC_15719, partial [Pristionchus entomophagus]
PVIMGCFIHRHQVVMVPGSRWSFSSREQALPPLLYGALLMTIPPIAHLTMQPPGAVDQYAEMFSLDWPAELLSRTDCFFPDRFSNMCVLSVVSIVIFTDFTVLIASHTFATLRKHSSMSDKMKEYHRTMTKVLVLQSAVPVVLAQLPLSISISVYFLNVDGSLITALCFAVNASYSFFHSITVIVTTPVYRRHLKRMI